MQERPALIIDREKIDVRFLSYQEICQLFPLNMCKVKNSGTFMI